MPLDHVLTYTFKEDYTSKVAGIGIALMAENNSYSRSYPYDGDITNQGGSRQKMMGVGGETNFELLSLAKHLKSQSILVKKSP